MSIYTESLSTLLIKPSHSSFPFKGSFRKTFTALFMQRKKSDFVSCGLSRPGLDTS
ncbi:MAG: hypothetical protein NT066_05160 [Candidatus Omnitrophica bacterium]|nr:hypothetical protein [Candidatus Omnitrophota bacterium]